jgi:hypothetical protein
MELEDSLSCSLDPSTGPYPEIDESSQILFLIWIVGGGGGVNWVHSALRPLIGLLCQPRVIMMMENLVEWLAGET